MTKQKIDVDYLTDGTHYPVTLPVGECGGWRVVQVTVTPQQADFENLRYCVRQQWENVVVPGTYHALITPEGETMMSTTQMEYRTNKDFVEGAGGDVLVMGLGLGMLIQPLLANPRVKTLTIVEKEPSVIQLVAPHYQHHGDRLTIIQGDAFTYEPSKGYDWVYHDIWPRMNGNEEEMETLELRYAPWATNQGFWCRYYEDTLIDRWRTTATQLKEASNV